MKKHEHSINYAKIDLQLFTIFLVILFYFTPLSLGVYLIVQLLNHFGNPSSYTLLQWLLMPLFLYGIFYSMIIALIILTGLVYRLVPMPTIGERVQTYSSDWLKWGIKAEIWKMITDIPLVYSVILKTFSLRYLYFKIIGLKLHRTSMIATDVRIYDPHLLVVGKNVLLPVFSIFSGHLITGNTMYMQKITIGDNVSIGARSGFAPGVTIANGATIGFGVLFGLDVQIGENSIIDSRSGFSDGVVIGKGVFIGKNCFFGRKVIIKDGLKIPDYTNIPSKAVINNKRDLLAYIIRSKLNI